MLVSTNGNATQSFTNTLLNNGAPVTSGASYRISANSGGYTPEEISVDPATGEITFTKALYDKMTPSDLTQPTGPTALITIEATYQGKTASYAFTVTDHFSPRDLHTSVVLDGALYVIAGRETDATTGRDDVWRSADRGVSWSRVTPTGASVPFPMDYDFASAVLGTTIYIMGGIQFGPITRYDEVWQSTDRGVTWTQATNATDPKFSARSAAAAVVLGSAGAAKLYVIGGNTTRGAGTSGLDDVWESGDGTSWTQVNASAASGDKFAARKEHSAAAVGDTVYVIAGDQGGGARRDVWTSGDKGATWTQAARNAEFPARRDHASAAQGGVLYVIGGGEGSTRLFNDVWKSTDGGRSWVNVHKNP